MGIIVMLIDFYQAADAKPRTPHGTLLTNSRGRVKPRREA